MDIEFDKERATSAARRLEESLARARETANVEVAAGPGVRGIVTIEEAPRTISPLRRGLTDEGDPLGLERIIGESDLIPIFLWERGLRVAKTVARITVRDKFRRPLGHATGFLISPSLLMTNWHVFNDPRSNTTANDCAPYSYAEFDYEEDEDGRTRPSALFDFDQATFYFEDEDLDVAIIGIKAVGSRGEPIEQYGFNPIIPESGKVEPGEYVSIIQHPRGVPKQAALRENKVVDLSTEAASPFIFYETDTDPGSSGSPVYNDQWYVAALHHSGVPKMDGDEPVRGPDGKIVWIANEGIRISAICEKLERERGSVYNYRLIEEVLELGARTLPGGRLGSPLLSSIAPRKELEVETLPESYYASLPEIGYDSGFLARPVQLPSLDERRTRDAATLKSGGGHVLDYTHFSLVMSKSRRLAFFTACNIDGAKHKSIKRGKDKWYIDGRLDDEYQSYDWMYRDGRTGVDRGHLVRREDPNWGDAALQANEDTFHFTNCSPQYYAFNQRSWLDLENYVLGTARTKNIRVTVFTGPVLSETDRPYRGLKVPAEFWKVVVWSSDGELRAAGYINSQRNFLGALTEAYGPYRTYQRPITEIEALTGLSFQDIAGADVYREPDVELESLTSLEAERILPTLDNQFNGLLI